MLSQTTILTRSPLVRHSTTAATTRVGCRGQWFDRIVNRLSNARGDDLTWTPALSPPLHHVERDGAD